MVPRTRILAFILLLGVVPACFGGLFPGNHYGTIDQADLPPGVHVHLHARGGGDDHSESDSACMTGEEQSPIDLKTNPTETVTAEEETAIQEAEADHSKVPPAQSEPDTNGGGDATATGGEASDAGAAEEGASGGAGSGASVSASAEKRRTVAEKGIVELTFGGYKQLRRFQTENTAHGVQGSFPNQKLALRGTAIPSNNYELQQFYFHWANHSGEGSEHYVDGKKFAMEMHLVHLSDKFKDVGEALNQNKDRYALLVVGVLFDVVPGGPPNPHFQQIVKSLRCSNGTKEGTKHTDVKFGRVNLYGLIPQVAAGAGTEKVVTYDGSLTTHHCKEVVSWLVFAQPLQVSEEQVAAFRRIFNGDGVKIAAEGNAREVKPPNKRTMFVKNVVLKTA